MIEGLYVPEKERYDLIFSGSNSTYNTDHTSSTDEHYEQMHSKVYVFTDIPNGVFTVVDGIPGYAINKGLSYLKSNFNNLFNDELGVYVVKSYNLYKLNLNYLHQLHGFWLNNNPNIPTNVLEKMRVDLESFIKQQGVYSLKIRFLDFISLDELRDKKVVYSKLLNGYITRNLKTFDEDYQQSNKKHTNRIEISLKDHNNADYWMTVGENVMPLISSSTNKKNIIEVFNGDILVKTYNIDNLEASSIYNNKTEALNNRISSIIRDHKLKHEGEKYYVEKQKLSLERYKLDVDKKKIDLDYEKSYLNYKSEVLKYKTATGNMVKDIIKSDSILILGIKTIINMVF